jgi:hypothetical protein
VGKMEVRQDRRDERAGIRNTTQQSLSEDLREREGGISEILWCRRSQGQSQYEHIVNAISTKLYLCFSKMSCVVLSYV